MAKQFKNRALTIATVGLLSGSPITVATDGLIQQPVTPVVPPTEVIKPVVDGGRYVRGPLEVHYQKFKRFTTALRWGIAFESSADYLSSEVSEYKHVTRNFYDVLFSQEYRKPLFETYGSKLVYAVGIDTSSYADGVKPAVSKFVYAVNISSDSSGSRLLDASLISDLTFAVDISSKAFHIPVLTEANVYRYVSESGTRLQVSSKSSFEESLLNYYSNETKFYFDVLGKTSSKFISAHNEYNKHETALSYEIDVSSFSYAERAPVDIQSEEEELFILLAQILSEDDDG